MYRLKKLRVNSYTIRNALYYDCGAIESCDDIVLLGNSA